MWGTKYKVIINHPEYGVQYTGDMSTMPNIPDLCTSIGSYKYRPGSKLYVYEKVFDSRVDDFALDYGGD